MFFELEKGISKYADVHNFYGNEILVFVSHCQRYFLTNILTEECTLIGFLFEEGEFVYCMSLSAGFFKRSIRKEEKDFVEPFDFHKNKKTSKYNDYTYVYNDGNYEVYYKNKKINTLEKVKDCGHYFLGENYLINKDTYIFSYNNQIEYSSDLIISDEFYYSNEKVFKKFDLEFFQKKKYLNIYDFIKTFLLSFKRFCFKDRLSKFIIFKILRS